VDAKVPRPRYVITLTAHGAIAMQRLLPDRLWDWLLIRIYKFQKVRKELKAAASTMNKER
jgi:hypothetical protein